MVSPRTRIAELEAKVERLTLLVQELVHAHVHPALADDARFEANLLEVACDTYTDGDEDVFPPHLSIDDAFEKMEREGAAVPVLSLETSLARYEFARYRDASAQRAAADAWNESDAG